MEAAKWDQWLLETRDEVPKARLFEALVPAAELRRIAKARGVKPQGFRVERAPAGHLARELARRSEHDRELREELAGLLAGSTSPLPDQSAAAVQVDGSELARRLQVAEQLAKKHEATAERAERSAKKARTTLSEAIRGRDLAREDRDRCAQRLADLERQLESLGKSYAAIQEQLAAAQQGSSGDELTALREELQGLRERDLQLRRQNAELTSMNRELAERIEELEDLLPRGQRERLRWRDKAAAQELQASGYLPLFRDSFFRALQALERGECIRVWGAIATLLLHGTEPKGLAFKALQGVEGLHSIRAASHLRIYFTRTGDELAFEHAGHREEQDHYLKRRRDQ